jgi:hypothetical protein
MWLGPGLSVYFSYVGVLAVGRPIDLWYLWSRCHTHDKCLTLHENYAGKLFEACSIDLNFFLILFINFLIIKQSLLSE